MLGDLNEVQINVLLASILGDGELTKLYKNSRRKNSSYREHYGENQKKYREWKAQLMDGLFYITPKSQSMRSASSPLFTKLFKLFYTESGQKIIPSSLLNHCKNSYFLAVLYMDDGTLSISHRVNLKSKKVYITPHIFLYLQNYNISDLTLLKNHIKQFFNIDFNLAKRRDGFGYILRTTSTKETFLFLETIKSVILNCPIMFYKTNWDYRFQKEEIKWNVKYPNFEIVATSSERYKNYTEKEIKQLIELKKSGLTDNEIANRLGRSYWSVVYKLRELRKDPNIFVKF